MKKCQYRPWRSWRKLWLSKAVAAQKAEIQLRRENNEMKAQRSYNSTNRKYRSGEMKMKINESLCESAESCLSKCNKWNGNNLKTCLLSIYNEMAAVREEKAENLQPLIIMKAAGSWRIGGRNRLIENKKKMKSWWSGYQLKIMLMKSVMKTEEKPFNINKPMALHYRNENS